MRKNQNIMITVNVFIEPRRVDCSHIHQQFIRIIMVKERNPVLSLKDMITKF